MRSDSPAVKAGLLVVGVLLVAGVWLFLTTGGLKLMVSRSANEFLLFGGILLAVFVGGIFTIAAGSGDSGFGPFVRSLGWFFAGAGIVCLLVLSLCIGVLGTCGGWR